MRPDASEAALQRQGALQVLWQRAQPVSVELHGVAVVAAHHLDNRRISRVGMETVGRAQKTLRPTDSNLHGPAGSDVTTDPPPLPGGAVEGGDVHVWLQPLSIWDLGMRTFPFQQLAQPEPPRKQTRESLQILTGSSGNKIPQQLTASAARCSLQAGRRSCLESSRG